MNNLFLSSYDTRLVTRLSPSQLSDRMTGSTGPLWQSQVEDTIQEDGETTENGASNNTKYCDMVSCVTTAPGVTSGQEHSMEHRLVRGGIASASTRFSDV